MPSSHFANLSSSILELKRIYLSDALASGQPTVDQQEMARAFILLAHAEMEWFVEQVCSVSAERIFNEAKDGRFNASSLALLTFSALDPLNGGDSLGKKGGGSRATKTRFGDAYAKLKDAAGKNDGIREKHLAKLMVPLGLDADAVDPTWLSDVDAFCTSRGAFAHMSRLESRSTHLRVNPVDVWALCNRIVFTNTQLGNGNIVASFEGLDDWLLRACNGFGAVITAHAPTSFIGRVLKYLGLR